MVALDRYIWQGVASWLRERINRGLRVVPISLNVSRVDILACDVAEHMGALAAQYNLPPKLMRIEITETAYTGESEAVNKLTAATPRVSSTTAPCRRKILRYCSMVAITIDTLARRTLPLRDMLVPIG